MTLPQNNRTIVTLMGSSIFLLLALQYFWLRNSYRDASESFHRETTNLFRSTIFSLHDSIIQSSIERLDADSGRQLITKRKLHFRNALPFEPPPGGDTLIRFSQADETQRIEVIVSSDKKDTLSTLLRPIINRMHSEKEPGHFVIRLGPDSLRRDSLKIAFTKSLSAEGITLPFDIYSIRSDSFERRRPFPEKVLRSDVVRLNPMQAYVVSFPMADSFLISKIMPQILFSVFLTLLTVFSFYILYRSLRSQQKLMALKNDFISNVSHELKTPVATVSVALEALKNFNAINDPQKTSEYLEIAQNELSRLSLMTDKILKTSVFESRGVAIQSTTFDLEKTVQQVTSSMRLVLEARRISLETEKDGENFIINGSEEHMTNVLYNLVDNAIKYSNDNSAIRISIADHGENILVSVKDGGIGIPSEYHDKIFEKFFRVPTGDVHNTKGYGLGLSYVKNVVKSHHGEILVKSSRDNGSEFIITLPRGI